MFNVGGIPPASCLPACLPCTIIASKVLYKRSHHVALEDSQTSNKSCNIVQAPIRSEAGIVVLRACPRWSVHHLGARTSVGLGINKTRGLFSRWFIHLKGESCLSYLICHVMSCHAMPGPGQNRDALLTVRPRSSAARLVVPEPDMASLCVRWLTYSHVPMRA